MNYASTKMDKTFPLKPYKTARFHGHQCLGGWGCPTLEPDTSHDADILEADPPEGTWDKTARKEVTSYNTVNRMTDRCKNITLARRQLLLQSLHLLTDFSTSSLLEFRLKRRSFRMFWFAVFVWCLDKFAYSWWWGVKCPQLHSLWHVTMFSSLYWVSFFLDSRFS